MVGIDVENDEEDLGCDFQAGQSNTKSLTDHYSCGASSKFEAVLPKC